MQTFDDWFHKEFAPSFAYSGDDPHRYYDCAQQAWEASAANNNEWRQAAQTVGETFHLAGVAPENYYLMPADKWCEWAIRTHNYWFSHGEHTARKLQAAVNWLEQMSLEHSKEEIWQIINAQADRVRKDEVLA